MQLYNAVRDVQLADVCFLKHVAFSPHAAGKSATVDQPHVQAQAIHPGVGVERLTVSRVNLFLTAVLVAAIAPHGRPALAIEAASQPRPTQNTLQPHSTLQAAPGAISHRVAKPLATSPAPLLQPPGTEHQSADQIWVISTRGLGCPSSCNVQEPSLRVWQCVDGHWSQSSVELFLSSDDPSTPTSFFVHGNNTTFEEAQSIGMAAYRQLIKCSSGSPLRFVIWSWPSEPSRGILRDLRAKAERANAEGYYLAWLIDRIDPSVKVTTLGYSYGARVTTGALHALGGGRLVGKTLTDRVHPERTSMNAVLMAAAIDSDWLAPGHAHGQALTQIDRLLLLSNPCDRVLRRYRWIAPYRPEALGFTGLPNYTSLTPYRASIQEVSVCDTQHDWTTYLYSSRIVNQMRPLVFTTSTMQLSAN